MTTASCLLCESCRQPGRGQNKRMHFLDVFLVKIKLICSKRKWKVDGFITVVFHLLPSPPPNPLCTGAGAVWCTRSVHASWPHQKWLGTYFSAPWSYINTAYRVLGDWRNTEIFPSFKPLHQKDTAI